jgi:hypothetical protein
MILIHKTANSPEITLADIQAISSLAEVDHMRDVIRDCATQIGSDTCLRAHEALDVIEDKILTER